MKLLDQIAGRNVAVGIVGLGYVGLPLAVAFAAEGISVIGVDTDESKINALLAGNSYVRDISNKTLATMIKVGSLKPTTDYDALACADAIIICVPTPLSKTKDPDMSFVVDAAVAVAEVVARQPGKLVVLESTTYPGTTEEVLLPPFNARGLEEGKDFLLAFSPERIDPGRTDFTVRTTPKVIGGIGGNSLAAAVALYSLIVDTPVPVSSAATAEMVKLLENTFRAVNIGLVNEVALICDKLGLNVWEVVGAASTKPYGFMPFYPGPGLGGHCIPIDPLYLSWKMRTLNYTARFIELAAEVNGHMPDYVVGKVSAALNRKRKPLNGSRILVLGVAYKRDVNDVRESPALEVIHLLQQAGASVIYSDPHVPQLATLTGEVLFSESAVHLALLEVDCAIVVTDHTEFDWEYVGRTAKLVVDTRNVVPDGLGAEIVRL